LKSGAIQWQEYCLAASFALVTPTFPVSGFHWSLSAKIINLWRLKRKGVEAHGLHFFNDGSIAIPARDIDENITTLQTINSNGKKRFSKGGKVKGSSHCIGEISEQEPVCFCEGYATGASIHEATGYAVVVCFDSGNIKPVIHCY
jgi:putative DNA primase/helicase